MQYIFNANGFCLEEIPLHNCIKNNDLDMIKLLISYGANIHANEEHPLYVSLELRHHDITKYLIEHGADVNAINTVNDYYLKDRTVLTAMAEYHHDEDIWKKDLEILPYLINHGADISAKNNLLLR